MTFTMAIKRLEPGKAIKTLKMAGYVFMEENTGPTSSEYPKKIMFMVRDGRIVGSYGVRNDFTFVDIGGNLGLDTEIFGEIANGDWIVGSTNDIEAERSNPGVW